VERGALFAPRSSLHAWETFAMSSDETKLPWFVWPFWAIWRLVALIIELTGRLVAAILGLVLMIVGVILTVTVIGAIVGIPLIIFGFLLIIRGFF
jgi:hypothetical protein